MHVVELWRYPVKSLQGEPLTATAITNEGISADRAYALFDLDTGFGLTARRVPELLFASARMAGDGVEITLPDGSRAADDAALSAWLHRRVALKRADEVVTRRYENVFDFEDEASSAWFRFEGAGGAFHDSRSTRVSLLSTGSVGDWDRRRFRANVIVDGDGEDALVDSVIAIGGARLDVTKRINRCVMTTRPQPDGIDRDLEVLRTIHRTRRGCLAVGALVDRPGSVRIGDEVATV